MKIPLAGIAASKQALRIIDKIYKLPGNRIGVNTAGKRMELRVIKESLKNSEDIVQRLDNRFCGKPMGQMTFAELEYADKKSKTHK